MKALRFDDKGFCVYWKDNAVCLKCGQKTVVEFNAETGVLKPDGWKMVHQGSYAPLLWLCPKCQLSSGEKKHGPEKKGLLEKQIRREFQKAAEFQYTPLRPRNQAEVAGMLNQMLANIIKKIVEARKEILQVAYSLVTIHDIPKLQGVLEKWFGDKIE